MNSASNLQALLQPQRFGGAIDIQIALRKLLAAAQMDETIAQALSQDFQLCEFQLGNELNDNAEDKSPAASDEQNAHFYVICQGKVRLICPDLRQQRDLSVMLLETGQCFGAESIFCQNSLPYTAIAASPVTLARISGTKLERWLKKLPQLRDFLDQQATRLARLIFLRTSIAWDLESASSKKTLTSHQAQQLLFFLETIEVPAGAKLVEAGIDSGYFWLYQGEIDYQNSEVTPAIIGESWGEIQKTPSDWIAKTKLLIYKVSIEQWKAISSPVTTSGTLGRYQQETIALGRGSPQLLLSTSTQGDATQKALSQDVTYPTPANQVAVNFPKPARHVPWQPKLLKRYPLIQQQSAADCGVACIAMIGQYWGNRLSLNTLRELAKVGRSGASLKNLALAAENVGFQARPVRASLGRMAEQKNPWIAHWEGDHYVVVYRVKGGRVLVADPARGKRNLTHQDFLKHWSGYALMLDPTPQLKTVQTTERNLKRFWEVLWSYRSVLWQIILLSLLLQLFGLVTPLFTQIILDQVVTQKSLPMLHLFSLGLLLFSVWRIGLVGVRQYLLDYFSNRFDLTLISGFVGHALVLPLKFFESRQVGDILTRVQENSKIQAFLTRQAVATWLDTTMAIVYLGLMFYYNWHLTLFVIALIPPIVILTLVATPFLRQISREAFSATAEQNSLLVEMMTGVATVKSVAAEREVRWRWEDRLIGMLNIHFKAQKLTNGLQVTGGLVNSIGSTALLWYGASLVIQDQLTIGQFVAFNMLIGNVIGPVLALVGLWDEFQEVLISVERLNDVFSVKPEETPGQSMLVLPPIRGEVQFEKVTFRYEQAEERNTLENISAKVEAGQTIAIVGRSGSGKSTLIKLLQGLYHPTTGRIWIDGHDIKHVSPQSLRSQLGVVPQECFLFSGTILENIQLYRPEYTLEQVVEVAKLAEAHGFIQDLPLGYNTKVGERGANLSGGQRQRIAIARALLGQPAILILDEATSSLDTESERRFQQNLARISRGRTTFVIAHRLSTVRNADRIWVLDRGVLAEQGTPEELIELKGIYAHLAQQQLDL